MQNDDSKNFHKIYRSLPPDVLVSLGARWRGRLGRGRAQKSGILDLAHLIYGRGYGRGDHRGFRLGTAQQRWSWLLRGGLISDLALRAVGRVLEARPDLAQVERCYVPVALVVPLRSSTPAEKNNY